MIVGPRLGKWIACGGPEIALSPLGPPARPPWLPERPGTAAELPACLPGARATDRGDVYRIHRPASTQSFARISRLVAYLYRPIYPLLFSEESRMFLVGP